MIQELFGGGGEVLIGGGGGGGGEERKISIVGGGAVSSSSSSPSDNQNLRCPRCDSSNTKFCYYNNYNLTQPRHFCKTCRRYWTKGGALRNVPIGGGCRKSKSVSVLNAGKSNNGKSKPPPSDVCKPSVGNGYSHDLIPNPILWATQQNSQLLALLRASQNQNPNPNPSSLMIGSHETPESAAMMSRSLDPLTQVSIGLSSSLWRTSQNHHQQQLLPQHTHQQQTMLFNEVPNPTGTIELYQRLRSSSNYYTDHPSAAIISNAATTPCTTSIVEPNSAAGGELGYWASSFSWPDLPTTNSAFP